MINSYTINKLLLAVLLVWPLVKIRYGRQARTFVVNILNKYLAITILNITLDIYLDNQYFS